MEARNRAEPADARLPELEDGDSPTGLGHPRHFPERRASIGHVSNAKRDAATVERIVVIWKRLRVADFERNTIREPALFDLVDADVEHPARGIAPNDLGVGMQPCDHQCEVGSPGRQVEHARAFGKSERRDGLPSPRLIDTHRHEAIEHVVATRDLVEHLTRAGVRRWRLLNHVAHGPPRSTFLACSRAFC